MEKSKLLFYMEDGAIYEYFSEETVVNSTFVFNERQKEDQRYVFKVDFNYKSAAEDTEKKLFHLYNDFVKGKGLKKVEFYVLDLPAMEDNPEIEEEKYILVYDSEPFGMDFYLSRYTEGYDKINKYFVESISIEFVTGE